MYLELPVPLYRLIRPATLTLLCVSLVTLSSCATVRGWRGGGEKNTEVPVQSDDALDAAATTAELESELLQLVRQHLDAVEADSATNQGRIIRKRPYYFKEYSNYVDSVNDAEVILSETESRTSPYVADVKLEKVRYATRLHRQREEARLDNNFLRDSGTETLSYELRNGRWTRVGSFFLAERTEEQLNGEWVPVQRKIERTVQAEEPQQGWFGRTWSRITGAE